MSPKILTLDIETMANLSYTWGFYEQNVIKVVRPWYVLCVGYKWLHEKRAHVLSLPDFPAFKKNIRDDADLMKVVWKLMDEADLVITQNGDAFDIKKLNTRFLIHGLPPYSPFKSIDTKKTAKANFAFINNKLDNQGEELGLGNKETHEGFPLWEKCDAGDLKAYKKMASYCKRDIYLTEAVYLKHRPYIKNHPNLNIYTDRPEACPACLSKKIHSRGERIFKNNTACQMWRCDDCKKPIYGERLPQRKLVLK